MKEFEPLAIQKPLYGFSGVFRPLDVRKLSHKVLLALVLLAALVAGVLTIKGGDSAKDALWKALLAALGVYGAWALLRELLVDGDWAAYTGAAMAFWVVLEGRELSLLLLFATLAQVRMLSRSVGAATWFDSIFVCALTLGAMLYVESALFWMPGMLAFAFDALCKGGARRQWLFALLCIAGGVAFALTHWPLMRELGFATLPPWIRWLAPWPLLGFVLRWFVRFDATSETSEETLAYSRLRAAAFVACAAAFTPLFVGYLGLLSAGFVWATMVCFPLALLLHAVLQRFAPSA